MVIHFCTCVFSLDKPFLLLFWWLCNRSTTLWYRNAVNRWINGLNITVYCAYLSVTNSPRGCSLVLSLKRVFFTRKMVIWNVMREVLDVGESLPVASWCGCGRVVSSASDWSVCVWRLQIRKMWRRMRTWPLAHRLQCIQWYYYKTLTRFYPGTRVHQRCIVCYRLIPFI